MKAIKITEALADRRYYQPTEQGKEKQVKERLEEILRWKHMEE